MGPEPLPREEQPPRYFERCTESTVFSSSSYRGYWHPSYKKDASFCSQTSAKIKSLSTKASPYVYKGNKNVLSRSCPQSVLSIQMLLSYLSLWAPGSQRCTQNLFNSEELSS